MECGRLIEETAGDGLCLCVFWDGVGSHPDGHPVIKLKGSYGIVCKVATVVQWLVPQIVALRTQARILAVAIFIIPAQPPQRQKYIYFKSKA
jgi:hypothetical protein